MKSSHHSLRRLRGIIIHRSSVREKDRVIEAFTREEGRVRFFAPGVRHVVSRRAGHLETLMESELILSHSSRGDVLSEARVIKSFPRLREDYARLEAIFECVKMIRSYVGEGQADSLLYDIVLDCMNVFDQEGEPPEYIQEIVAVHILRSIGALPDLYFCNQCRKKLKPFEFSLQGNDRGFWCANCSEKSEPSLTEVVKLMRIFLSSGASGSRLLISSEHLRLLRQITRSLLYTQGSIVRAQ